MTYTFGTTVSTNQVAVRRIRHGLAVIGLTYEPGDEGFDFLAALYERHPDIYPEKIVGLTFVEHYDIGGREAGVVITDATGITHPYVGYSYCLMPDKAFATAEGRRAHWQKVRKAKVVQKARAMVAEQTARPAGARCKCGAPAEDLNHAEIDFKDIWESWQPPGPLDTINLSADGARPMFADLAVHQSWLDWHAQHAVLEPLCKACHKAYTYH